MFVAKVLTRPYDGTKVSFKEFAHNVNFVEAFATPGELNGFYFYDVFVT